MQLDYNDTQGLRIVTVGEARIDAAVAIAFKDRMRELCIDGPERIVLDMTQVGFIDSSGLGAVVASMKQLGKGKNLELAGLSPAVRKVFKLTRMDTVFTIHASAAGVIGDHVANAS